MGALLSRPRHQGRRVPRLAQQAPAGRRVHGRPAHRLLRAEELQHLVLLRLARAARAGACSSSPASSSPCFYKVGEATAFDSVEYIMREVPYGWLHPLPAFHRRLVLLHRRLPAHVPRAAVRVVQGAARAAVALRHADLPRADGRSVHGLRAAVGQHVVLGRAGDREPVRHDPGHRRRGWSSGFAATTASRMRR